MNRRIAGGAAALVLCVVGIITVSVWHGGMQTPDARVGAGIGRAERQIAQQPAASPITEGQVALQSSPVTKSHVTTSLGAKPSTAPDPSADPTAPPTDPQDPAAGPDDPPADPEDPPADPEDPPAEPQPPAVPNDQPPAPAVAPGAAVGVACVSGDMADRITFQPPADGGPVTEYTLLQATSADGPFEPVATAGADARGFVQPVAATGTWFYRVASSGPGGPGPVSDVVSNDRVLISSTVGSDGALLRASNGEVTLQLAPGSFGKPTDVTVSEVPGSPTGGLLSLAGMYELSPSGTLGAPARFSVRYTLNVEHFQVAEAMLAQAALMTFSDGSWVSGASNVRAEDGYLSGDLAHFSYWIGAVVQPHGTSATTYCSDGTFCHNLSEYPGAATRYASRDAQVCFNCHGNGDLALGPAGATGENVEASLNGPGIVSRHPVASGDLYCTACHDAHTDPVSSPGMLRATDAVTGLYIQGGSGVGPGDAYCWACHGPVRNRRIDYLVSGYWTRTLGDHRTGYTTSAHGTLTSDSSITCTLCHAEHGSVNDNLLGARLSGSTEASVASDRATGAYAQACLKCHDGGSWAAQGAANIKQYVTAGADKTDLLADGGHRIKSAGGLLPVNAPLPCDSCHGPHGTKRGNATLLSDVLGANLNTTSASDVRKFCLTCHVTPDLYGWDSTTNAYAAVSGSATVQGLLRNGGANGSGPGGSGYNWLRLKAVAGHARTDANSCYECHGNDYSSASANNVHNPGSYSSALHNATPANASITVKGVSYGPLACSGCHDLELGPLHDEATASSAAADCGACHPSPRNTLAPWAKGCVQGGCHTAGSTAPMHQNIDTKHNAPIVSCTTGSNCHNAASGLAAIHAGASIEVGGETRTSCAVCHADGIPTTSDCATCHGFTEHPPHTIGGPCQSANCHVNDAMTIHGQPGGPGCDACHGDGVTPTFACRACHANPHPNSAVVPTLNHGPATDQCSSCHSTASIMGVHGDNCDRCHPSPAGPTAVYAGGCKQAGCHPGIHESDHTSQDHGDGPNCGDCHGTDEYQCVGCHSRSWERAKPVTTTNAVASYTGAASILISAVDQGDAYYTSGVKTTYWQLDGQDLQTSPFVIVPGPATGTQRHSLEYWSLDNHYNVEAHHIIYFTVTAGPPDTTPPSGTMSVSNGATYTNGTATVNSAVVGCDAGMRVDPGTGTYGPWVPYAASVDTYLSGATGSKTVRVEYRDAASNVLTLSDTIIFDNAGPTGTILINGGATATNNAVITMTNNMTDSASGVAWMSFAPTGSYSAWEPYAPTATMTLSGTSGTKSVWGRFMDGAGNVSYVYDSINYDLTPPTGTMSINGGAAYTSSQSATLSSSVSDTYSGVASMRFSNDGSSWTAWENYATTKAWTLTAGDGAKLVYAEYRDGAGNVYATNDAIVLGSTTDATPPTGTITINGGAAWTNSNSVTLTLSATDSGSGVYQMCFSNDNIGYSAWEAYGTSKSWTMSTAAASTKYVYVKYRDAAGNESAGISDSIGYEVNRPNLTLVIDSGAFYTDSQTVTLSVSAGDGMGGSGVTQMQFSNDYGSTWSAWEPYSATKSWTLSAGIGHKTVTAQVRDAAGNVSFTSSDGIAYQVKQTLTYTAGANGYLTGATPQTVNYGASGTAVTAVPLGGYRFLGWSDGRVDNPRTDTGVFADVNATAWFAPAGTYTVQFKTDGSGYISSGAWIQAVYPGGSTVAVTATPYESSYAFAYWSNGTTTSTSNPLVITNVNSQQTWTAYFTYTGSCPFLFTWDGSRYGFEADEFAAGYLGLRTSKGYRRPNPIDYHVLETTPAAKDGALEYKLVEEREETDYLDQVKLYAVDAPADRQVWVERSQAEGVGQFTTLSKVIHTTLRNLEPPQSVGWVNNNVEVRDKVAASDGDYVVLNEDRNAGYNYQTLELDLGDVRSAPMVKLIIDGRTMIPTSQDGRAYSRTFGPQAKLEVQDAEGNWVLVPSTTAILPKPPEFDRPFVLNLTNVWISDSRKVRLTYLYKTYIDAILLDTSADVPVTLTELPLQSAELAPHGFDFRMGIGEWYDYVYGAPFSPPSYKLPGNYTKFGDVTPLLGSVDDKFVIFGGGDEITMRFDPPSTEPTGNRRYLFFSNGYYKTLKEDIPHTVAPLPFAAMSNFPYAAPEAYPTDAEHQAYLSEWNTRYEGN